MISSSLVQGRPDFRQQFTQREGACRFLSSVRPAKAASIAGLVLDDGTRLDVSGVFIELGAKGAVQLAVNLGVNIDSETLKYLITNKKQETNIPGIYAAGDICGPPWQVAKAIGEGCIAGLEAAAFVKKNR